MPTAHRITLSTAMTVLALWCGTAQAQQVQLTGPLAGAPACRECRVYRSGRIQLQPFAAFTLQDEFSRTALFGAQATLHLNDWLGLGVWGAFGGLHLDTDLTDEVVARGDTTDRNALSLPSRSNFDEQIGTIQWVGAVQLTFVPLRGKLGLFEKIFVDADFHLFGGAALVGIEERADVTSDVCGNAPPVGAGRGNACIDTQFARASRVALAPTFGAGITFYMEEYLGLVFEWRGLPFSWNTSGTDEAGRDGEFPDGRIDSDDRIFHFNHMVMLGLAFYLPPSAGHTE